ncbi:hypothetical protein BD309DRAFT_1014512 [Dichomitus squalens]|uniref:Uncharacterized protein n=1 Tax=Dichomitus squalens TaxID=114155 RepID=A0A4Q9N0B0_9APHY|nr:hypothetical protein BD311DRAFT_803715 [Dichomitus squalens]TBU49807.1 hypothetical protein BD309DRAFT_1014512 [Dichomitus squalens]
MGCTALALIGQASLDYWFDPHILSARMSTAVKSFSNSQKAPTIPLDQLLGRKLLRVFPNACVQQLVDLSHVFGDRSNAIWEEK